MSLKDRLNKVLDRIDDLSSKLELSEKEKKEMIEDPIASQIEELLEEEGGQEADQAGQPASPPPRLEIEWEAVAPIVQLRNASNSLRSSLSELCIEYEIRKRKIMNSLEAIETNLAERVQELRDSSGLPEEAMYNLRLPDEPNDSGEFILREE